MARREPKTTTMEKFAQRLLMMTLTCRPDMHEPDEQGITAEVLGRILDNAHGDNGRSGEYVVQLTLDIQQGKRVENFNLATLIALARLGATTLWSVRGVNQD